MVELLQPTTLPCHWYQMPFLGFQLGFWRWSAHSMPSENAVMLKQVPQQMIDFQMAIKLVCDQSSEAQKHCGRIVSWTEHLEAMHAKRRKVPASLRFLSPVRHFWLATRLGAISHYSSRHLWFLWGHLLLLLLLLLSIWLQSFFRYPSDGTEIMFYIPTPGMEFFSHVYCLTQTFFFGTNVSRAENWSSAPMYSTG